MKTPITPLLLILSATPALSWPIESSQATDRIRDALTVAQNHLAAASADVQHAVASVDVDWNELPNSAQTFFRDAGAAAGEQFAAVDWDALPQQTRDWITEHPYQTAFYVVNGVVFLAPGLVTGPMLGILGFTRAGPAAGPAAAAAEAAIGPVAARGGFATLQSAAMGGYGAAVVAGGTQAGALIASGAVAAWNYFEGKRSDSVESSEGENMAAAAGKSKL